jgi:hypothetical protein
MYEKALLDRYCMVCTRIVTIIVVQRDIGAVSSTHTHQFSPVLVQFSPCFAPLQVLLSEAL